MNHTVVLEGFVSVAAALEAASRPLLTIYVREDKRDAEALKIARMASAAGVPVERAAASLIAEHAAGVTHGGIIALAGERRYLALGAIIEHVENPFVVMLDGIEDPYNLGQAIRACYAAGVHGLVVRPRTWQQAAGIVARASAGTSERMPTAQAETAEAAANFLREQHLCIAVAASHAATSVYEANLSQPLFLLIGGERRGVTRSFADKADVRLKLPYGRDFEYSLGTTAATAGLVFEVMRQRRYPTQSSTPRR